MAARRARRDGVAPPPSGGPGPDPGGGVRSSGWGSRSQAPYGTVGAVSSGEQVRDWRAARGWQQSGVCRAVTRGRHRKREEAFGSRCRVARYRRRVGPSRPGSAGRMRTEAGSLRPFLRNARGAEPGVGNMARGGGGEVKDSYLES